MFNLSIKGRYVKVNSVKDIFDLWEKYYSVTFKFVWYLAPLYLHFAFVLSGAQIDL